MAEPVNVSFNGECGGNGKGGRASQPDSSKRHPDPVVRDDSF
jgi:hypothetical protein